MILEFKSRVKRRNCVVHRTGRKERTDSNATSTITKITLLILVISLGLPTSVLANRDNAVKGHQPQTVAEISQSKNMSSEIKQYPLDRIPKHMDLTPLNLTEEQKQTIQQMRTQSRLKIRQLRKSLVTQQNYLRQLIFDPTAKEVDIKTARKNLHNIKDQVDELNLNDLLGIRGLLTQEQLQKLPQCILPATKDNPRK